MRIVRVGRAEQVGLDEVAFDEVLARSRVVIALDLAEVVVLEQHDEVVEYALKGHDSGALGEPSLADERLTQSLKDALAMIDVRVCDHFSVAGTAQPISFAERGLL